LSELQAETAFFIDSTE